jgi:SAM-dependent methyltransferase
MRDITQTLTKHYDSCLIQHGPTAQGMDWGDNTARLSERFDAIGRAIDVSSIEPDSTLLDVGCGCGLLLDHILSRWPNRVEYTGIDASAAMIDAARRRHPNVGWIMADITDSPAVAPADWVIANGLLTEKRDVTYDRMVHYAQSVLVGMFNLCRRGIVFNVLSSHVNFENEMLFYWDPGEALSFCTRTLSRHVVIHHDLESYEYYCTVRRDPWQAGGGSCA